MDISFLIEFVAEVARAVWSEPAFGVFVILPFVAVLEL
jgi:hypothetical protein